MLIFYDVETTGLPDWRSPSDAPHQPHIIQLAALLAEDDGAEVGCLNTLIEPDGWTIPAEVTDLTGISMERAKAAGIPIKHALNTFIGMWLKASRRVAHNDRFDARMMRIELKRLAEDFPLMTDTWASGDKFCTMTAATPICNLPPTEKMLAAGFTKRKSPKLIEAYRHFFGRDFEGAHDALADVRACKEVYFALIAETGASGPIPA